jgi:Zn-dependent M28 family amino/carboxypeptidase
VTADYVRSTLSALADDSMQGRKTATPGAARAARFIASQFAASHLAPLGDSGYLQKVPLILNAKGELAVPASATDTAGHHSVIDVNVVAVIRGSDPVLKNQVILVDAHFDHLGVGKAVNGDSIYNGADDDASGVVTVLAVARALAAGPPLKRTVLFVTTTGEELGLFGTRWLIAHFPVPIDSLRANLEIEMIGRPDPLIGAGKAWLTGYERTTMGAEFKAAGLAIFPDPHPEQQFFQRSDNIAYAEMGVPAQTLSSYGLHTDYHAVTDDLAHVDIQHMTAVINTAIAAVRLLADGPEVEWLPGGRPKS